MFNEVELFKEPLEILGKLTDGEAEMTEWQSSFLCGLIKKYKPQKIVEVGVAAGGTTAIILNCLAILGLNAQVHSVDISEKFYRDRKKKTGHLAEEYIRIVGTKTDYRVHLGGVLPEYLDIIGDNIDFLILDSVHNLPGEMLDFLACFPKLKRGAVVVLHDIILNHLSDATEDFATKVLFSSVVGEKIICSGDDNPYSSPGIGVFRVTEDTGKYIENIFSALTITWKYVPDAAQLELYRKVFQKYYDSKLVEEFDDSIKMNKKTLAKKKRRIREELHDIYELALNLGNAKNIYIYGCGVIGNKVYDLLESFGISVEGYVISDNQIKPDINRKIEYISDVNKNECTFVLGMNVNNQKEVYKENKFVNWICVSEGVLNYIKKYL